MRAKIYSSLIGIASLGLLSSCDLGEVLRDSGADSLSGLTESEIVSGLQESLVLGSKTAALGLNDTSLPLGGYLKNELVRIALPDTVQAVFAEAQRLEAQVDQALEMSYQLQTNKALGKQSAAQLASIQAGLLDLLGISSEIAKYKDNLMTSLNRGAEAAAPGAVNVFKDAIFGMSFSDARGLLSSKDTIAATSFLKGVTYTGLNVAFKPVLKVPLDALNPNQYWSPIAGNFNTYLGKYNTLRSQVNAMSAISGFSMGASRYSSNLPTDLSEYLATYGTGKALDGLFYMVGVQESKLRADPWAALGAVGDLVTDTVGDLIGKVFSEAGN